MLKRIDHIGIVVDDLEAAKRFFGEVLQLPFGGEVDRPERSLKAAFFRCGGVSLEAIEVREPTARQNRLGDATARLEHVAIEVDDLHETIKELGRMGVRTTSHPRAGDSTLNVWADPDSTDGVLYQFLEYANRPPSTSRLPGRRKAGGAH